jgi:hypothetical protein
VDYSKRKTKQMCSWIVEKAEMFGVAKGQDGWTDISQANVYFDHPFKAPLDHALVVDFMRDPEKPDGRVSIEISAESARRLVESINKALATGEAEHLLIESAQA